jgi:hypothetical protein
MMTGILPTLFKKSAMFEKKFLLLSFGPYTETNEKIQFEDSRTSARILDLGSL